MRVSRRRYRQYADYCEWLQGGTGWGASIMVSACIWYFVESEGRFDECFDKHPDDFEAIRNCVRRKQQEEGGGG